MFVKFLGIIYTEIFFLFFFVNNIYSAPAPLTPRGDGEFATLNELTSVFANITAVVSTLIGFALLIMLIRGGVGYITAQGDPKAVASARSTITWAIVGFLVVLASYLIISLLTGFFPGLPIDSFCIPTVGVSCP